VLALPLGENNTFERKGSRLLDLTLTGVKEGDVLDELAKQLSAFGSSGGGRIIYGVKNDGAVDNGGVARFAKGRQSTKEWLEDVIPNLTEFEILGFNVYEVLPNATSSLLAPNKSLYVVDIPDSERAPHQSTRDQKYYVRLGGKSRPATHRLVEDIRNRSRYPKLEIFGLQILNANPSGHRQSSGGSTSEFQLGVTLLFELRNSGGVRATSACLQLSSVVSISASFADPEFFFRSATPGTVLLEFRHPLYPGMGVRANCLINMGAAVQLLPDGDGERLTLEGLVPDDFPLTLRIFADSAPARKQEFKFSEIDPEGRLKQLARQEAKGTHGRLQRRFPGP
jgi:hypothetical protein